MMLNWCLMAGMITCGMGNNFFSIFFFLVFEETRIFKMNDKKLIENLDKSDGNFLTFRNSGNI